MIFQEQKLVSTIQQLYQVLVFNLRIFSLRIVTFLVRKLIRLLGVIIIKLLLLELMMGRLFYLLLLRVKKFMSFKQPKTKLTKIKWQPHLLIRLLFLKILNSLLLVYLMGKLRFGIFIAKVYKQIYYLLKRN